MDRGNPRGKQCASSTPALGEVKRVRMERVGLSHVCQRALGGMKMVALGGVKSLRMERVNVGGVEK